MTSRKIAVFFYGLFMDMNFLQQRGLHPIAPQVGCLDGYAIEIRERATLLPTLGERVYGVVASLTHEEIRTLYSEPSVLDYRPEAVLITLEEDYLAKLQRLTQQGATSNFSLHLTATRLRFGLKPKGYGWVAAGDRPRWAVETPTVSARSS
jgi:hypothetical protein